MRNPLMRIGELATRADVNVETIRYYERRGLLAAPNRRPSGYRVYDTDAVRRVHFIRRAQELGFTLHEIQDLLTLWRDSANACDAVEARARAALGRIDDKIADLERMRRGLGHYVAACQQHRPLDACPLLRELAGTEESIQEREERP